VTVLLKVCKSYFSEVRALYKGFEQHLAVGSILDGNTKGQVYVDKEGDPGVSAIWPFTDALYVSGESRKSEVLIDVIEQDIAPGFRKWGVPGLIIYYDQSSEWETSLKRLFGNHLKNLPRRYYDSYECKDDLTPPQDTDVIPIKDLVKESSTANQLDWLKAFWPSVDEFSDLGVGYCALRDGKIISWCLSIYASGNRRELGVETDENYRGIGLGSYLTSICACECISRGFTAEWHCRDNNPASVATARKAGFSTPVPYMSFYLEL
jgi:GNAT superfamily N-acetyltransferase